MTDETFSQNEIDGLIVGHFDASLTEEQEQELADALSTSAEAKRRFTSYMRMEGRLHSLGRDGFLGEPDAEPVVEHESSDSSQQADNVTSVAKAPASSRRFAFSMSWIVSAAAVLVISFWVLWPSTVSAADVLREAQQAAAELIARTYRVTLLDANANKPARELLVDVRGGGRFVVRPVDGAYVMGSDGTDYWLTRPGGPVWMTSDYRSLAPKLQRLIPDRRVLDIAASANEPLLLDITGLLSLIEHRCDIELVVSDATEHHVRATRQRQRRNGPAVIDFWADAETGVVLRANAEWSATRQHSLELVESVAQSETWYHYSEHATGREVRRLDSEN